MLASLLSGLEPVIGVIGLCIITSIVFWIDGDCGKDGCGWG